MVVRYESQIGPTAPRIGVNRIAPEENIFQSAAAGLDAYLSQGKESRINKNITAAEEAARDTDLGISWVHDVNGIKIKKFTEPVTLTDGSRSSSAYNNVMRRRFERDQVASFKSDIKSIEIENMDDLPGFMASVNAYTTALGFSPEGYLGSELLKEISQSENVIAGNKKRQEIQLAQNLALMDYQEILIGKDPELEGVEPEDFALRYIDLGGDPRNIESIKKKIYRQQAEEILRFSIRNLDGEAVTAKLAEIENNYEKVAESLEIDTDQLRSVVSAIRTTGNNRRQNDLNNWRREYREIALSVSKINLDISKAKLKSVGELSQNPLEIEALQSLEDLGIAQHSVLVAMLEDGTVPAEIQANVERLISSLAVNIKSVNILSVTAAREFAYNALANISYSAEKLEEDDPNYLTNLNSLLDASKGDFSIAGMPSDSSSVQRQAAVVRRLTSMREAHDANIVRSLEAQRALVHGNVDASSSTLRQEQASFIFRGIGRVVSLADTSLVNDPLDDGNANPTGLVSRFELIAGLVQGDLSAKEIPPLPISLRGPNPSDLRASVYIPRVAASLVRQTKTLPSELVQYLDEVANVDPDGMQVSDLIYVTNLVSELKAVRPDGNLRGIGLPETAEVMAKHYSFFLATSDNPQEAREKWKEKTAADNSVPPSERFSSQTTDDRALLGKLIKKQIPGYDKLSSGNKVLIMDKAKEYVGANVEITSLRAASWFLSQYSQDGRFLEANGNISNKQRYSRFTIKSLSKNYNIDDDLVHQSVLEQIKTYADKTGQKLKLGENVFLRAKTSNFGLRDVHYELVRSDANAESGDSLVPSATLMEDGTNFTIDIVPIIQTLVNARAKEDTADMKVKINNLRRIQRSRNFEGPSLDAIRRLLTAGN